MTLETASVTRMGVVCGQDGCLYAACCPQDLIAHQKVEHEGESREASRK